MSSKDSILKMVREYSTAKDYFSIKQIKNYFKSEKIRFSDLTIKQYLSALSQEKIIYSSGQGYYSTIEKELKLDYKPLAKPLKLIVEKFPFLKLSLWSSEQLSFAFHHTQTKFIIFVYTEKDYHEYIRDFLDEHRYNVYINPQKKDITGNLKLTPNTIILRPFIIRGTSIGYYSTIEKILVDFLKENNRFNLVDDKEYERIFAYIVNNYRIRLSSVIDYSKRRKLDPTITKLLQKYTNVTF